MKRIRYMMVLCGWGDWCLTTVTEKKTILNLWKSAGEGRSVTWCHQQYYCVIRSSTSPENVQLLWCGDVIYDWELTKPNWCSRTGGQLGPIHSLSAIFFCISIALSSKDWFSLKAYDVEIKSGLTLIYVCSSLIWRKHEKLARLCHLSFSMSNALREWLTYFHITAMEQSMQLC